MAFTDENKLSICKITGTSLSDLNSHIADNPVSFAVETQVVAELNRWTAGAGSNFVRIHPNDRNFGAEIDPSAERADIRRNIVTLLQIPSSIMSLKGGVGRTVRG